MRLTEKQTELLNSLREGKYLRDCIASVTDQKNNTIRYQTMKALMRTGELVRVRVKGKHGNWTRYYHKNHVPEGCEIL